MMKAKINTETIEIVFSDDYQHIKKGTKVTFGAATAANFMRLGVAWPSNEKQEAKLPETIKQIKEKAASDSVKKK